MDINDIFPIGIFDDDNTATTFTPSVTACHNHDGWRSARPVQEFYDAWKAKGKEGSPIRALTFVDRRMEAYGDWTLYVDDDGNYYEEYDSIGD